VGPRGRLWGLTTGPLVAPSPTPGPRAPAPRISTLPASSSRT
jgi:hypothetical protein